MRIAPSTAIWQTSHKVIAHFNPTWYDRNCTQESWSQHSTRLPGTRLKWGKRIIVSIWWLIIQATCNALGGYLVEIESKEEQDFVWNIKKSSRNFCLLFRKVSFHLFRICCAVVDRSHGLWSGRILDLVSVKETSWGEAVTDGVNPWRSPS